MPVTEIIILGTNGNCVDIADAIETQARAGAAVSVLGFLDDAEALQGQKVAGYPVLGRIEEAGRFPQAKFVNGIGSPRSYRIKPNVIRTTGLPAERWVNVIHPAAVVSPRAVLGRGVVLLAGVSVGARARLGDQVLVLQNSVISHDTEVGRYTTLATSVSVSGHCVIGENCYLGSNATLRERVRVGDRALVGMSAVVTKDVAAETTVIGNPARPYHRGRNG